ncbi:toll-like receptor 3 [Glandiceps talaboti]
MSYLLITLLMCLVRCTNCAQFQPQTVCKFDKFTVDCSHKSLREVPQGLPQSTKVLILSHNTLPRIIDNSFKSLPNLEYVDLSYNSISRIEDNAFDSTLRLKTLLLSHNEIGKSLTSRVFAPLKNLTMLDLAHNRMKNMPTGMLTEAHQIQYLSVAENRLESVDFGKDVNMSKLEMLNLSRNSLEGLRTGEFAGLGMANLSVLDLSFNQITDIDEGVFQAIRKVKVLNVSGSFPKNILTSVKKLVDQLKGLHLERLVMRTMGLQTIGTDMFEGFNSENLTSLDLSDNNITVLTNYAAFRGLGNLQYLTLDDNSLHHFEKDAFKELESIVSLSLNNNALTVLMTNMFAGMATLPLKYLYIRNNVITSIQPGAFNGLGNLLELNLYGNKICQPIVVSDNFIGMSKIERIDLGTKNYVCKHMNSLGPNAFSHLRTLKYLYLNSNSLSAVDSSPSSFQNLSALQTLDLSNNNIDSIAKDTFAGLRSLDTLYLQHNNLKGLWQTSHPGGPVLMFDGLSKMQNLHLGWNGFDNIPEDAFKKMSSLIYLALQYNQINFLPVGLFNDTKKLEKLELDNNMITVVNHTNIAPFLKSLKVLNVNFNPFSCTCDLEWFRKWLDTTTADVVGVEKYECFSPPSLHKHLLLSYHPSPWECDHVLPIWACSIIISVSVAIIIVVASTIRYRWYCQFCCLRVKLRARYKDYEQMEGINDAYLYDAYISYSDIDKNWIEQHLLPKIEECNPPNFKLCYRERDFTPGVQLDKIADNIEKSRKTLCLLSENYLNDEKCTYEQNMAKHSLLDDNKDVLVLIVLKKVPGNKLNKYEKMHKLMKRKAYLEWPEDKPEKQLVFWEKLKIILSSGVKPQREIDI